MSSKAKVRYLLVSLILWVGLSACRSLPDKVTSGPATTPCEVRVLRVEGGFGYEILNEGKVLIRQTQAPALAGLVMIPTAAKARKLGRKVCEKLDKGQWPPSLNAEEVEEVLGR